MSDTLPFLAKGLVLGFSIAAPVGPIGVLCFRRALERGFWPAVAGGLGTAVADAAYAAVAAFGITAVSAALLGHQRALALVGGAALLWLGARAFFARPAERAADAPAGGARGGFAAMFAATFLLTLANPATILSFAAVFAGLGLVGAMRAAAAAAVLVAGVFAGSMLWWIVLSGTVSALRQRVPPAALGWVNRASGVLLGGFGLWVLRGALAQG
ncbi:MAG: LysE family translocator [Burkholderiales bacterium]|nr:LysE family translocator [Burkholderiales bacterium]